MKAMNIAAVCPAARIAQPLDAADVLVVSYRALSVRITAAQA